MATNSNFDTTEPVSSRRFVNWILDTKGTSLYGDEQERLRWYEGISAAASIQWLVVPWVIALGIWIGGRPVVSYLIAVAIVFVVPQYFAIFYAMKNRVRLPNSKSPGYLVISMISGLSIVAIVFASIHAYDNGFDPDGLKGAAVGGPIGGLLAALLIRRYKKSVVARPVDGDDD